MPGKPSDNDGPLAEPPENDDGEWEEAGCRELAEDFLGIILIVMLLTWMLSSIA